MGSVLDISVHAPCEHNLLRNGCYNLNTIVIYQGTFAINSVLHFIRVRFCCFFGGGSLSHISIHVILDNIAAVK